MKLVVYFSASNTTKNVAIKLSKELGCDIYEIKPKTPYTSNDLNWLDKFSRSSVEMKNKSYRPEIITNDIDLSIYDEIILGFPIWWYVAPLVVNTFLESYDFNKKIVKVFATSGGSGFGNTIKELQVSAKNAKFIEGRILNSDSSITKFVKEL